VGKKVADDFQARRAQVLWRGREAPSRGPKPTLSTEAIVRAAIRVADGEGLGAVSMQRVAQEVGMTTMALYRYVESKEELIDWMIEVAGGRAPAARASDWRDALRDWVKSCAEIYRRHMWFQQAATARRRVMGPNELDWLNAALAALRQAGLTGREQMEAFLVLVGHVRSRAEFSGGEGKGLSGAEWMQLTKDLASEQKERYAALLGAIEDRAFGPSRGEAQGFGLECILAGIEQMARGRKAKSRRARD
jgi:AcrR family transcriptional regulator